MADKIKNVVIEEEEGETIELEIDNKKLSFVNGILISVTEN